MLGFADLEKQFSILQKAGPFRQSLEITGDGLLLGVGTRLAGPGPGLDHARILALLASAYGQGMSPSLLTPIEKAAHLWQRGEKCLAQLHLCFTGLPPLSGPQAFALYAGDALLHDGLSPRDLLKGLGLDPSPLDQLAKYNPNHRGPGAHGGEFTTSDASGTGSPSARAPAAELTGHGQGLSGISAQPAGPTVSVAQDVKCSAFIAEKCKGSILREFPGEYLNSTIDQILKDAQTGNISAKKAKKLLFDNRFRK